MKYLFILSILFIFPLKAFAENNVFPFGVASGDPLTNQVIIWTKINSESLDPKVKYQVSENKDFSKIISEERKIHKF
jgi:alkaline phosphatase D